MSGSIYQQHSQTFPESNHRKNVQMDSISWRISVQYQADTFSKFIAHKKKNNCRLCNLLHKLFNFAILTLVLWNAGSTFGHDYIVNGDDAAELCVQLCLQLDSWAPKEKRAIAKFSGSLFVFAVKWTTKQSVLL